MHASDILVRKCILLAVLASNHGLTIIKIGSCKSRFVNDTTVILVKERGHQMAHLGCGCTAYVNGFLSADFNVSFATTDKSCDEQISMTCNGETGFQSCSSLDSNVSQTYGFSNVPCNMSINYTWRGQGRNRGYAHTLLQGSRAVRVICRQTRRNTTGQLSSGVVVVLIIGGISILVIVPFVALHLWRRRIRPLEGPYSPLIPEYIPIDLATSNDQSESGQTGADQSESSSGQPVAGTSTEENGTVEDHLVLQD